MVMFWKMYILMNQIHSLARNKINVVHISDIHSQIVAFQQ